MARRIYLLRHGEPEGNRDERKCIGRTDIKLSDRGKRQAEKISEEFLHKNIQQIYSSPLSRCVETARIVQRCIDKSNFIEGETSKCIKRITICEDLQEISGGEWENRLFSEIKKYYFKEYEERGKQIGYYAPPKGESFAQAGERFGRCLKQICRQCEGNFLVVAHAGAIRGFLCQILGISVNRVFELSQPCAGVTVLEENIWEGKSHLSVFQIGYRPIEFLDEEEIRYLYQRCGTPEPVISHMQAVSDYIKVLVKEIPELHIGLMEKELLLKAALVHDIARIEPNHAERSAILLEKEGYYEVARLVRTHHGDGLSFNDKHFTAEELLFYADKRVQQEQIVSIEERFSGSMSKCKSSKAKESHYRQFEMAKKIESKLFEVKQMRR